MTLSASGPRLRPDRVYAMALYGRDRRVLLGTFGTPFLMLPGGPVLPQDNTAEDAVRRIVYQLFNCDSHVIRSIGPRYVFDGEGDDATAFEVVLAEDFVASHGLICLPKEAVAATMILPKVTMHRMVWDALSVLEPWTVVPSPVPADMLPIVEGIYCDPGVNHCLVEDYLENGKALRRLWPRLDPHLPTGKMEP